MFTHWKATSAHTHAQGGIMNEWLWMDGCVHLAPGAASLGRSMMNWQQLVVEADRPWITGEERRIVLRGVGEESRGEKMVVGSDLEEREDSVGKVMKHAAQVSCLWCKASLDRWLRWGPASTLQPARSLQLSLSPSLCLHPYLFFFFSRCCHLSFSPLLSPSVSHSLWSQSQQRPTSPMATTVSC